MLHAKSSWAGCGLFVALALGLAQRDPAPGEVVMTSAPYTPRTQSKFEAESRAVEVGVVVRDPAGHPVAGLTKNDFEIADEGKKRPIDAFSVETAAPVTPSAPAAADVSTPSAAVAPPAAAPARASQRYVAILFDDFSMQHGELIPAQSAARDFVKEGMRQGDHAALFTMSEGQVTPFTDDAAKLADAIGKIRFNSRALGDVTCPTMTPFEAYQIANQISLETFNVKIKEDAHCRGFRPPPDMTGWTATSGGRGGTSDLGDLANDVSSKADSLWQQVVQWSRTNLMTIGSVVNLLARAPGQRTLLLASSGFLSATLEPEMDQVIRQALRGGVVISSIDAKGLFTTALEAQDGAGGSLNLRSLINITKIALPSKEATNDAPAALALNTGGLFFHNRNDVDAGFRQLGIRPEVRYLLSFTPEEAANGKYHSLKVRLKNPGKNIVQARMGYMALKPVAPPKPAEVRPIDTAAVADGAVEDLSAELSAHSMQTPNGQRGVMTVFHVDIQRLKFREEGGVRRQKLSLIAILMDGAGNFVAAKEGTVTLALKDATYQDYAPAGMNFTLTLPAPAGAYRVRAAMGDEENKLRAETIAPAQ